MNISALQFPALVLVGTISTPAVSQELLTGPRAMTNEDGVKIIRSILDRSLQFGNPTMFELNENFEFKQWEGSNKSVPISIDNDDIEARFTKFGTLRSFRIVQYPSITIGPPRISLEDSEKRVRAIAEFLAPPGYSIGQIYHSGDMTSGLIRLGFEFCVGGTLAIPASGVQSVEFDRYSGLPLLIDMTGSGAWPRINQATVLPEIDIESARKLAILEYQRSHPFEFSLAASDEWKYLVPRKHGTTPFPPRLEKLKAQNEGSIVFELTVFDHGAYGPEQHVYICGKTGEFLGIDDQKIPPLGFGIDMKLDEKVEYRVPLAKDPKATGRFTWDLITRPISKLSEGWKRVFIQRPDGCSIDVWFDAENSSLWVKERQDYFAMKPDKALLGLILDSLKIRASNS